MYVLWGLLAWLVPLAILIIIVRAITNRGHKPDQNSVRHATYRDAMLATIGLAGGYAGAVTLYYLPLAVFGNHADNAVFATRFVLGILLLVSGLLVRHMLGVFLMVMGLTAFVLAAPFVFDNLGSGAALIVAFIAFAVLVFFAVRMGRKNEQHG